jgi:hypothetical protein
MQDALRQLARRVHEFIECNPPDALGSPGLWPADSELQFESLALELFGTQTVTNPAFRAICTARGLGPAQVSNWRDIPAVPAAAFKECDLTSLPEAERSTEFRSSGTTGQVPSRHFHSAASLALYEASLKPWFGRHLLANRSGRRGFESVGSLDFIALVPPPETAPHSSLVYMIEVVRREFGSRASVFVGRVANDGTWELDIGRLLFAIGKSVRSNQPIALLGTAFNFVHLTDRLVASDLCFQLPEGSRVMETGGYKGRSRELPRAELHALITRHLGIPATNIVTEYGMSELSSQAYGRVARRVEDETSATEVSRASDGLRLQFPPWARAVVVSPETGREVPIGETGLLRIYDLANVWSVLVVQTEDLAVRREEGFELLGRAIQAEPRGCSLMTG